MPAVNKTAKSDQIERLKNYRNKFIANPIYRGRQERELPHKARWRCPYVFMGLRVMR